MNNDSKCCGQTLFNESFTERSFDTIDTALDTHESTSSNPHGSTLTQTNLTVTSTLSTNTISERTSASGVTIDGCLIKDGGATLSDATTYLADDADPTKKVQFQISGITTGTTRTLTVPDTSDTIVTLGAAQTLSNKTLTTPTIQQIYGASNGITLKPNSSDDSVGGVVVYPTTASTSKTSGSLVVNGGCGIAGSLYPNAVYLPTSGGTPSAFNFYEEATHVTTFTLGTKTTGAMTLYITRIGRFVSLFVPYTIVTNPSTSTGLIMSSALPSRFRPTTGLPDQDCWVISLNVWQTTPGRAVLTGDGILSVYLSNQTGTFPSGTGTSGCGHIYMEYFVGA